MSMSKLPKLIIFGDPEKDRVADTIRRFEEFVADKAEIVANCGVDNCSDNVLSGCDFAVVFGGDGAIISVARSLSHSGVPVIGVNLGKLGFLAEFSVEELEKYFGNIISSETRIEKRMLLTCKVLRDGKEKFCSSAVNDCFITAGLPFRAIELEISVDGESVAGCVSDGLIISTPTGSTAYNLSAGGPIISGKMEAIAITAICPHSLSFRPIVINADRKVEVIGIRLNQGTTVSIDGQASTKLSVGDIVAVEREDGDFLIVNNPIRTQWETLATKLRWAKKPKYEEEA